MEVKWSVSNWFVTSNFKGFKSSMDHSVKMLKPSGGARLHQPSPYTQNNEQSWNIGGKTGTKSS